MSGRRIPIVGLVGIVLAMLVVGCAKPPLEKIEAAEKALAAARLEQAEQYAPEQFATARALHTATMAAIRAQQRKAGILRNYDKAAADLDKVVVEAKKATAMAQDGRLKALAAQNQAAQQEAQKTRKGAAKKR